MMQHRPSDVESTASQIAGRDYKNFAFVTDTLKRLEDVGDTLNKVKIINRKLTSIPDCRRNAALQKFMDTYCSDDHYLHCTSAEQRSYAILVSSMADKLASGEVLSDDLRVASQVASGALRRDGLVLALMRSAIHMNQAAEKGALRTRTSRYLDHDALGWIFISLIFDDFCLTEVMVCICMFLLFLFAALAYITLNPPAPE